MGPRRGGMDALEVNSLWLGSTQFPHPQFTCDGKSRQKRGHGSRLLVASNYNDPVAV